MNNYQEKLMKHVFFKSIAQKNALTGDYEDADLIPE